MSRARAAAKLTATSDVEQHIPALARAEADRARQTKEPVTWSGAIAKAPWSRQLPPEYEMPFRRAYAERLVERGLALPVGRSRTSGASGKNTLTEVKLRGELAETERWRAAAQRSGTDRNTFLRRAANQLADEILGE